MTSYDNSQRDTCGVGYTARHRPDPSQMQVRLPATQRTKAARRGFVFLVVAFTAPLVAIGACLAIADDRGKGHFELAERQEYLRTGDTDVSSASTADPADPALLPAAADVPSGTPPTADGGAQPLLIDDFDGQPGWTGGRGRNDLGRTTECEGFARCAVTGGALVLKYEDNGWFGSYVDHSLTDYTYLVLRIRGERGGEESDIRLTLGGVQSRLASLVLDGDHRTITTSYQDLRIPLAANRIGRTTPGELQLDFWHDGSSAVHIEEIRFE
ncbi:hypothetical protein ABGB16_04380 [Micromonospora sp. B11E3]|uniref:hypothetical protein n=1 Tax=Micromonospora sp. B11E3 TaxID=3153562 RepID=UPI00325E2B98